MFFSPFYVSLLFSISPSLKSFDFMGGVSYSIVLNLTYLLEDFVTFNEFSVISVPFLPVQFPKLFKLCLKSFEFNELFSYTYSIIIIGHHRSNSMLFDSRTMFAISIISSRVLIENKYISLSLSSSPPYNVLLRHLVCYNLYFVSFWGRVFC